MLKSTSLYYLSQDAVETETVSGPNICNALLNFGKTSSPYEMINVKSFCNANCKMLCNGVTNA